VGKKRQHLPNSLADIPVILSPADHPAGASMEAGVASCRAETGAESVAYL
jgi:hypothetical protein